MRYMQTPMEVKQMLMITVSGQAGSGTSTLVAGLCQAYSWDFLNGGMVFRSHAKARSMGLAEFSELCKQDLSVDRALDEELRMHMNKESGPQVVESRLAGWWAFKEEIKCVRLWLEVSVDERARRVITREAGEHLQRKQEILAREQSDLSRFEELYGLNPSASTPYTHVLDATALNQEEVLAVVQSYLKEAKE